MPLFRLVSVQNLLNFSVGADAFGSTAIPMCHRELFPFVLATQARRAGLLAFASSLFCALIACEERRTKVWICLARSRTMEEVLLLARLASGDGDCMPKYSSYTMASLFLKTRVLSSKRTVAPASSRLSKAMCLFKLEVSVQMSTHCNVARKKAEESIYPWNRSSNLPQST